MRKLVAPSGREPWTVTRRRWIESPAKRKCTKNLELAHAWPAVLNEEEYFANVFVHA